MTNKKWAVGSRQWAVRATLWSLVLGAWSFAPVAFALSPAVEAVLELPRTEPRHYVEAVLALVDLGEGERSAPIVEEMVALKPTPAECLALVDRVGSAGLAKLARVAPKSAEWVSACLAAADAATNDPARLKALTSQLVEGELDARRAAIDALRRTGAAGVEHCLAELAGADEPTAESRLREALVALEPASVPALLLGVSDEDEAVRTQSAYALGRLADLGRLPTPLAAAAVAAPAVLGGDAVDAQAARWAFARMSDTPLSPASASALLDRAIDELLARGAVPFALDGDGLVAWQTKRGDARSRVTPRVAALATAARFAQQRAKLSDGDDLARLRAPLLTIEAGTMGAVDNLAGLADEPTYNVGVALEVALDGGLNLAAVECARLLGQRRDASALFSTGGQLTPLARSLDSPSPDVRWAAVEAILAIAPEAPFAGSSRVADVLAHFAAARGDRLAVVAMPSLARGSTVAGMLAGAGFTATPVVRGDRALAEASSSPDVEFALLDLAVIEPGVRETLFRLRRTTEAALLPVAITADEGRLADAEAIVAEVELEVGAARALLIATPRVNTPEGVASLAAELNALRGDVLTPREAAKRRLSRAAEARKAIVTLLENGPEFYGLGAKRRGLAAVVATRSKAGAEALAVLGTPESQVRLVDDASLASLAINTREAAAEAFRASVATHGLLLTSDEVLRQYDRYNALAAASADEATIAVLGSLLDTIETRRAPSGARR
ncbi:MAG: HEAT repeat domain-containing protein [Lacipirellulaceae bacterium]